MDESPAEAMHSGNSNAVEDQKITPSEYLQKLIDEKKNSTSSLHADPLMKRNRNISLSPAEERHAHDPIFCPSFFRRKVRQEEIALREYKKMKQVWANRGLLIDRETMCSAASKDTFDLKDLSESQPSTSASVNKQKFNGTCTRWRKMPIEALSSLRQRFERERHEQIRRQRVSRSSASEGIPSSSNSMEETLKSQLEVIALLAVLAQKDLKREHKSYDRLMSKSEKIILSVSRKYQELCSPRSPVSLASLVQSSFGSKFAQMSIDDGQDEKDNERQNSDAENHLPRPELNVLPSPMTNDVSKLATKMEQSSWNTEKNRTMKLHFPGVLAPLNSPVKKAENAGKNDAFLSRDRKWAESRQKALRHLRKQNKLKTRDSYRKSPSHMPVDVAL